MAIAERLIIANYDSLDNKPIINQDLTALGFVPVANTYYRHTGNTTSRFTKGLIYKYDGTQFKELGTGQEVDLSHYIRVEDLTGLLPNVQYALVHNADNEFTPLGFLFPSFFGIFSKKKKKNKKQIKKKKKKPAHFFVQCHSGRNTGLQY